MLSPLFSSCLNIDAISLLIVIVSSKSKHATTCSYRSFHCQSIVPETRHIAITQYSPTAHNELISSANPSPPWHLNYAIVQNALNNAASFVHLLVSQHYFTSPPHNFQLLLLQRWQYPSTHDPAEGYSFATNALCYTRKSKRANEQTSKRANERS